MVALPVVLASRSTAIECCVSVPPSPGKLSTSSLPFTSTLSPATRPVKGPGEALAHGLAAK
jgi:hypothetical protein